ncbi:hypothetical protein FJV76_23700 [Mesorhizobium sp. WSM4303]|uniref:COG3904 family protein n=1 Tax=unclassified Mesorhizobium TaxID=325217 RepID=UPI00115DB369|nr:MULTISPECIES: hypothetical protein [unclassified Mesorhizobium]TRD00149.1 hypothetical protein FJV76_23700 [Mesorhizobium sp. WSM4303]TRD00287.1 hypothetical protein FJV77_00070 [Mesorhizobium sp. WSM4306]
MVPRHRFQDWACWALGLTCLVSLLAVGSAAFAAETKNSEPDSDAPMRFVVVRSNAPGCEPTCPEWISAEGAITAKSPALLKAALKTLGRRKLPIVVNSPGGDVDAAIAMGRMIRKNKLDIAVGRTWFVGCDPGVKNCKENDAKGSHYIGNPYVLGSYCASACPMMLAGGTSRLVGPLAFLGVHQITTTVVQMNVQYEVRYRVVKGKKRVISKKVVSRKNAGSYKTYEMSKKVERKLATYFQEMGVDLSVLETMKSTPASDIQQIDLSDMLAMKLVTSEDSVSLLTNASLCTLVPLASNCREIPANKPAGDQPAVAKAAPLVKPQIAQPDDGMRFVVVRGSNPLCNPDCPEWIAAQGAITPQTPQKLSQLLATLGNRRLPVVISSRGGDLFGALAAGRIIHEKKLDVAVARTDFVSCDPAEWNCLAKDGAYAGLSIDGEGDCDSACALMLAGGARRLVGSEARLSLYLMGQKQTVKAYLDEMAISPALFTALQRSSVERQLEPDMMLKVGLTTGRQSVDALTGSSICKSAPKPGNCRVVASSNGQAEAPAKL